MNQIRLHYKSSTKILTLPSNISQQYLEKLLTHTFSLKQKIVGLTDKSGKFYDLNELSYKLDNFLKETYYLVTSKDLNEDNMSFGSEIYQKQFKKSQPHKEYELQSQSLNLTKTADYGCIGDISNLQIFQQLFLQESKLTIINSYTKIKPPQDTPYPFYLYKCDKNSTIIYSGVHKICQFFINDWSQANLQIVNFIKAFRGQNDEQEMKKSGQFKKKSRKVQEEQAKIEYSKPQEDQRSQKQSSQSQSVKEQEIKSSFIQNLNRLYADNSITNLDYYKLKSEVLENPQQFMRKYQMGTRQGLRKSKYEQQQPQFSRDKCSERGKSKEEYRRVKSRENISSSHGNRVKKESEIQKIAIINEKIKNQKNVQKKYQIPIIVRKYNNVVEKISTSYPLSLEQQQSINLILELELKGLITEKQAGVFKSLILQQDQETFSYFEDYFNDGIDQMELSKLLKKKVSIGTTGGFLISEGDKDKGQDRMRLIIRYSKRSEHELMRKLVNSNDKYISEAFQWYKNTQNGEGLKHKFQKIAKYYRARQELIDDNSQE